MVRDTGLLEVVVELEVLRHLQQQHMVGVELEHQETVLQDHLLVVEMHPMDKDLLDFKIPAVAVEEVKECQHHPISSIQVVMVPLVSFSLHTILDK
tara:strand:+ start:345 stop:632 length:288 start_codon:yes stop_codon:yes gene_type:complete